MNNMISFVWDGKSYEVSNKAYDLDRIVLPDGRILQVASWLETFPVQLGEVYEVEHTLRHLSAEEIAQYMNGVLATEVTTK